MLYNLIWIPPGRKEGGRRREGEKKRRRKGGGKEKGRKREGEGKQKGWRGYYALYVLPNPDTFPQVHLNIVLYTREEGGGWGVKGIVDGL